MLLFTEWDGGRARDVHFQNNLFLVEGSVRYQMGKATGIRFSNNLFWGHHQALPPTTSITTNKPTLVAAGTGGSGFASLHG